MRLTPTGPRVFVAVDPPQGVRDELERALAPLRGSPGEPRWIPPDRWHLTLLFLGTVPADRLPLLVEAAGPAVAATPPLTLRLSGGGRFGALRRPQVMWAGVAGDVAGLADLAGRLTGAARALGLPVEDRPFRPHLTVGRWRPRQPVDGDLPGRLHGYGGSAWPVTEVCLLESRPGPAPGYGTLARWPVAG